MIDINDLDNTVPRLRSQTHSLNMEFLCKVPVKYIFKSFWESVHKAIEF